MPSEGDNMPNKMDQKANTNSVGCGSNQFFFIDSRQFTKAIGVALYPRITIYYKNAQHIDVLSKLIKFIR
jgi:hypothetical protein